MDKEHELDVHKLHAEVNQIVQQCFTLTTLAILGTGTICGWLFFGINNQTIRISYIFLMSALLIFCFVFVLFAYFIILLGRLRIFTSYLVVHGYSPWERDWKAFRAYEKKYKKKEYIGYTKGGKLIFGVLFLVAFFIPLLLAVFSRLGRGNYPEAGALSVEIGILSVLFVLWLIFTVLALCHRLPVTYLEKILGVKSEEDMIADWQSILNK